MSKTAKAEKATTHPITINLTLSDGEFKALQRGALLEGSGNVIDYLTENGFQPLIERLTGKGGAR